MNDAKYFGALAFIVFVIILVITLVFDGGEAAVVNSNASERTFIVLGTEIKRTSAKGSDLYLVNIQYVEGNSDNYTTGAIETVQVKDNWLLGNWRSADLYFSLKTSAGSNEVWKGRIGGVRNGFFSWFPHIVNAEPTGITLE